MKIFVGRLSYLCILMALPLMAGEARIYVTHQTGNTIQVVDPATNEVVQVIEGIQSPKGVGLSPDGSRVYISSRTDHALYVVDQKTGNTIRKVPLSGQPNDLAVTKNGKQILVCIRDIGALDVIDTSSFEKVKSIPSKRGIHDIQVTLDGKYAIAGSDTENMLMVFDLRSEQLAWEFQLGSGVEPMAIESGPDGSARRIFVQIRSLYGFVVVDFAKHEEVERIKLPDEPSGFAGVTSGASSHGIGLAPDGKSLWVNGNVCNCVFAYSVPELKLLGHVRLPKFKLPGQAAIGAAPIWITFTPDSKSVYVANSSLGSLVVIDAQAMTLGALIPVGANPDRISAFALP